MDFSLQHLDAKYGFECGKFQSLTVFVTGNLRATFLVVLGLLSRNPKYQDSTQVNTLASDSNKSLCL